MENTDLIERLVAVEEARKSNTKRIDEHEEKIEKLEDTYAMLQKMDYRMGKVETAVEKIDNKLSSKINEESENKGKKWDKFIDYVFYFILATILTFIAIKLGLK